MRNYATLFDSNYLSRGLVLYESLVKHSSEEFRLFALCLDDESWFFLDGLNLPSMFAVFHPGFKLDQGLVEIEKARTRQEFAWTCASQICEWVFLHTVGIDEITYLDADMMFFSDPEQVFAEIGNRSIAAIPHRFESPKLSTNGRFNVSWVTFRGEIGRKCLSRWAAQCRAWCYYRAEPGRFGDQKYLDEWPELYGDAFCEIQNIGVGLAPWNIHQYKLTAGPKVDGVPVVFYHYHEFKEESGRRYRMSNYTHRPEDEQLIYAPYIAAYQRAKELIHVSA